MLGLFCLPKSTTYPGMSFLKLQKIPRNYKANIKLLLNFYKQGYFIRVSPTLFLCLFKLIASHCAEV